jgi:hypothetical protein
MVLMSIFFCFIVSPCFTSATTDNEYTRSSLQGLVGVYVVVEVGKPDSLALEINEGQIKTDVELRLRILGIKVVSKKEDAYKIPGTPTFYISIYVYGSEEALSFVIIAELLQRTYLERNKEIQLLASTWATTLIGLGTKESIRNQVRDSVKDSTDKFCNAYLSVNPKGGK